MTVSTHTSRRAWVEIDLAALVANARSVEAVAGGARLLPMVKANAYGLGAVPVARALDALDPWGYGVATAGEAFELREAGITRPILVFTPPSPDQLPPYRTYDLTAVHDDPTVAAAWDLPHHLEIDTGMSRCGIRWDDPRLSAWPSHRLTGCFTHFHSADVAPETVVTQWDRFREALDRLPSRPGLIHAAGSAAAWRLDTRLDLVRPGVFLYGGMHAEDLTPPQPVATLRAPIVSRRRIAKDDSVSYAATWHAPRSTTIATLGIGYADGIPRAVEGRAQVVIGGRRYPIVGRVTMDFVMLDMGDMGDMGDVGTLIGEGITVSEFAEWAGSNTYEVLARLGSRIERVYS